MVLPAVQVWFQSMSGISHETVRLPSNMGSKMNVNDVF